MDVASNRTRGGIVSLRWASVELVSLYDLTSTDTPQQLHRVHPACRSAAAEYAQRTVGYYVTTPIYYVNAEPHLGHAYSTIAADILARHMRQRGEDVFFLTGTDEHGEPVTKAAERDGLTPQRLVDRNAPKFQDLMPKIEASNDFFIRTSDPEHIAKVQEITQRVHDNGYVYEGVYEGWYCPRCAAFYTEDELGPGQTCPIHEIPLEREREENWFFRLSAFEDDLKRLYAERPDFVQPEARRNEVLSFINSGLEDVSLSRPKLTWGVPLPWDPDQVMYVWFDALLNYVTALSYAREGEDLTERFWPAFHIIGKDILRFHSVYWPAFLLAAGLEPPKRIFIHGFLLMGEKKMSKSLGNVLDPFEVIERFGADALRFYCFREVSFGQDGSVSAAGFESRYETELANDWGNLASRTLAMIDRYREGVVPDGAEDPALGSGDDALADVDGEIRELLDRAELTQALEAIWSRVRRLNRYVEESKPWELAKDESQSERLDQVLYNLAEGVRVLALLLHAYMPETSGRLLEALAEGNRELDAFGARRGGQTIDRIPPLFPKLEQAIS
jgi:methionyl-tRNA synthetase